MKENVWPLMQLLSGLPLVSLTLSANEIRTSLAVHVRFRPAFSTRQLPPQATGAARSSPLMARRETARRLAAERDFVRCIRFVICASPEVVVRADRSGSPRA